MEKEITPVVVAEGVCPVCESEQVSYGTLEPDDDGIFYPVTCDKCGATWHECYDIEFSGVYNIKDNK